MLLQDSEVCFAVPAAEGNGGAETKSGMVARIEQPSCTEYHVLLNFATPRLINGGLLDEQVEILQGGCLVEVGGNFAGNVSDRLSASNGSVLACFQVFRFTGLGEMRSGVLRI